MNKKKVPVGSIRLREFDEFDRRISAIEAKIGSIEEQLETMGPTINRALKIAEGNADGWFAHHNALRSDVFEKLAQFEQIITKLWRIENERALVPASELAATHRELASALRQFTKVLARLDHPAP